jgi:hypothetical protein
MIGFAIGPEPRAFCVEAAHGKPGPPASSASVAAVGGLHRRKGADHPAVHKKGEPPAVSIPEPVCGRPYTVGDVVYRTYTQEPLEKSVVSWS